MALQLPSTRVPEDRWPEFQRILEKPDNFYSGYVRVFRYKGEEYHIDTRYDDDLRKIGLLG